MKQRIRTVGIIRNADGVLVFKRSRGRSEAPVFWELPTGKISFGEQPEEAMTRCLLEETGLAVSSIKLKDVVTFLAPEEASQLSNLYIVYDIIVKDGMRPEVHNRYTVYKYVRDFNNSGIRLSETSAMVLDIENGKNTAAATNISSFRNTANSATVYVDGASRGNPGPAGIGYYIVDENGRMIKRGGEFVGFATSRVAEYYALREGIEQALELGFKTVRFVSDNLMMVNQMNGIFQVKNADIKEIYDSVRKMIAKFDNVAFVHVSRLQNSAADKEANLAVDKIMKHEYDDDDVS